MIDAATRRFVRERARNRCEYCGRHQDDSPLAPLHVEHVVPRKHGGADDAANLAIACIDCNLGKSSNLSGLDPQTGQLTELYNPRVHVWARHFVRRTFLIEGITAIGRTTIYVLNMNSDEQIERRRRCET